MDIICECTHFVTVVWKKTAVILNRSLGESLGFKQQLSPFWLCSNCFIQDFWELLAPENLWCFWLSRMKDFTRKRLCVCVCVCVSCASKLVSSWNAFYSWITQHWYSAYLAPTSVMSVNTTKVRTENYWTLIILG